MVPRIQFFATMVATLVLIVPLGVLLRRTRLWATVEFVAISTVLYLDLVASPLGWVTAGRLMLQEAARNSLLDLWMAALGRLLLNQWIAQLSPDARYAYWRRVLNTGLGCLLLAGVTAKAAQLQVLHRSGVGCDPVWPHLPVLRSLETTAWPWPLALLLQQGSSAAAASTTGGPSGLQICLHSLGSAKLVLLLSWLGVIFMIVSEWWTLTSKRALRRVECAVFRGLVHARLEFPERPVAGGISHVKVEWRPGEASLAGCTCKVCRELVRAEAQAQTQAQAGPIPAAGFPVKAEQPATGPGIAVPVAVRGRRRPILVMFHGFGGGKSFYGQCLDTLAQHFDVYCPDMPGMAASDRPLPPSRLAESADEATIRRIQELGLGPQHFPDTPEVTRALAWFLGRLEAWRAELGLERFVLFGHSFGGYMAAWYALVYPERVSRLVLASPMGIPRCPEWRLDDEEQLSRDQTSTEAVAEATTSVKLEEEEETEGEGEEDEYYHTSNPAAETETAGGCRLGEFDKLTLERFKHLGFWPGPPPAREASRWDALSSWGFRLFWLLGGCPHHLTDVGGLATPALAATFVRMSFEHILPLVPRRRRLLRRPGHELLSQDEPRAYQYCIYRHFVDRSGELEVVAFDSDPAAASGTVPTPGSGGGNDSRGLAVSTAGETSPGDWFAAGILFTMAWAGSSLAPEDALVVLLWVLGFGLIAFVLVLAWDWLLRASFDSGAAGSSQAGGKPTQHPSSAVPSLPFHTFADYLYHVNAGPICADHLVFQSLCLPVGYALRPVGGLLAERIRVPTFFLYGGENDWIPYEEVENVARRLGQRLERQLGRPASSVCAVYSVFDAGHQLMLENPLGFQRALLHCLGLLPAPVFRGLEHWLPAHTTAIAPEHSPLR